MKNKWPKGILLAAGVFVLAVVGHVSGFNQYVVTKFNDLQCDDLKLAGNDILDSNGTTRITVGATNIITGSLQTSGTTYFSIAQSSAPRDTSAAIGITPNGATPQLVFNTTDKELCFSTGTTRFTWVEVSTPTAACKH